MRKVEFSVEGLREWQRDAKGSAFWAEVEGLFEYHVGLERASVRAGKLTEATIAEGYAMAMGDVLSLIDKIISENKKES